MLKTVAKSTFLFAFLFQLSDTPTEEVKLYKVHWASSIHPSRSTLQEPLYLFLSVFSSWPELYGLQQGSLAHWLHTGFGQWETPAGHQKVGEE